MKFYVGWEYRVWNWIKDLDQSNFTVNMGRNQVGVISNIVFFFDLTNQYIVQTSNEYLILPSVKETGNISDVSFVF